MANPNKTPRAQRQKYVGIYCPPELVAAIDELVKRRTTLARPATRADVLRAAIIAAIRRADVEIQSPLAKVGT